MQFAENAVPDHIFHSSDNGAAVNVPVGRRFRIELEENPTTGYRWSAPHFDASCLHLDGETYAPHEGAGVGGGGIRKFEFAVKSPCRTTVGLVKRRPWAADAAPQATFEITIIGER